MNLDEVIEFSKERGIQRVELFWIDLDQRWNSMALAYNEETLRQVSDAGISWKGSAPDSPILSEQSWKWWPDLSRVWSCPFSALPTLSILGFLRGAQDDQECAEDSRGYAARAQKRMESLHDEGQTGLFHWRGWFTLLRDTGAFSSPSVSSRQVVSQSVSWELASDSFVRDFASEWSLILERTQNPLAFWFPEGGSGQIGFETHPLKSLAAADQWAVLKRFARLNAEQHLWTASFLGLVRPGCMGSSVEVNVTSKQSFDSIQQSWESRYSQISLFATPSINSFRRARYLMSNKGENRGAATQSKRTDQAVRQTDGQMNPYLLLASLSQAIIAGPAQLDANQMKIESEPLSVLESWRSASRELDFLNEGQVFGWDGLNEYKRRRIQEEDLILQIPGPGDWELDRG